MSDDRRRMVDVCHIEQKATESQAHLTFYGNNTRGNRVVFEMEFSHWMFIYLAGTICRKALQKILLYTKEKERSILQALHGPTNEE